MLSRNCLYSQGFFCRLWGHCWTLEYCSYRPKLSLAPGLALFPPTMRARGECWGWCQIVGEQRMALRRIRERSHWASIVSELVIAIGVVALIVAIGVVARRVAEATPVAEFFVGEVHFYEELVGQLIGTTFGLLQRLVVVGCAAVKWWLLTVMLVMEASARG